MQIKSDHLEDAGGRGAIAFHSAIPVMERLPVFPTHLYFPLTFFSGRNFWRNGHTLRYLQNHEGILAFRGRED